ncbi:hypothetical protein Gohar_001538, partial [Gossypium harknessii]|nr:hypothetical protein [Gossypium harknessii]
PDFVGIVTLLLINSTISFIEENSAGNAAAALMAGLAPKTKVSSMPLSSPPVFIASLARQLTSLTTPTTLVTSNRYF